MRHAGAVHTATWLLTAVAATVIAAATAPAKPLKCMERFKVKDFVIGAWWGPDPSEANYRLYMDAGFNVLMTYRNRANSKYGPDYQLPDKEMKLAEKLGLWVMLDTYMRNDTPWGGMPLEPPEDNPLHHSARLGELKWLQERYGDSPVLAGYLLGDNCGLHDYMANNAKYLLETAPELFPWMSTNPDVEAQAKAPMPLLTTQNYPFLYQVNEPEATKRLAFCNRLELDRKCANRLDMALWPFINCCDAVSPSQLHFQMYASVAYGAQGIWYFHYNCNIFDPAKEEPGPLYQAAKECNLYVASIGPRVLGHRCLGVYHSPGRDAADGCLTPGPRRLIEDMSSRLLAGLLAPEERFNAEDCQPDYVMVVDKRTVKQGEPEPRERRVLIKFAPTVRWVTVFEPNADGGSTGKRVDARGGLRLRLKAGQGVLLQVAGFRS